MEGGFGTQRAIILADDGRVVRGITDAGHVVVRPWGAITGISSAGLALLEIPLSRPLARGTLALDVASDDPNLAIYTAYIIKSAAGRTAYLENNTAARGAQTARFARVRSDAATIFARAGIATPAQIIAVDLLLERSGDVLARSAVRISDLDIIGGGGSLRQTIALDGKAVRSKDIRPNGARLTTTFGTAPVAVALDLERGNARAWRAGGVRTVAIDAVNAAVTFDIPVRSRWFVFSERFGPGWSLIDAHGARVGGHQIVFGFAIAWYDARGLAGRYTLRYEPDAVAPAGLLAGFGMLLLVALFIAREIGRGHAALS